MWYFLANKHLQLSNLYHQLTSSDHDGKHFGISVVARLHNMRAREQCVPLVDFGRVQLVVLLLGQGRLGHWHALTYITRNRNNINFILFNVKQAPKQL